MYRMYSVFTVAALCIEIYDFGAVTENYGNFYSYSRVQEFEVWINRPRPSVQLESLNFDTCYCIRTKNYENSNCREKIQLEFKQLLNETYISGLAKLNASVTESGYRKRRSMAGLSMIFGLLNFGWNTAQEFEINHLKKVALGNADSIVKIAKGIKDTRLLIQAQNDNLYKNFNKIDKEICQNNEKIWHEITKEKTKTIVEHYWSTLEAEATSFMVGQVPRRLEYIHLVEGICRKTCHVLDENSCKNYCKNVLQNIPINMKPQLMSINPHSNGAYIVIKMNLPIITLEPKILQQIKNFGIIIKNNGHLIKKKAILSSFAVKMTDNKTLELDDNNCFHNEKNFICSEEDLNFDSCLSRHEYCRFQQIPAFHTCSYSRVKQGIVMFALKMVSIRNPIKLHEIGHERTAWKGIKFIKSEKEELVLDCDEQQIVIPAIEEEINITVTIKSYNSTLKKGNETHETFQKSQIKEYFQEDLQHFKQLQDEAHSQLKNHYMIIAAAFIVVFIIGVVATISVFCYLHKRTAKLDQEMNRHRPEM